MRKRNLLLIAGGIILIPALLLAWWLLSPLFLNQTVAEDFPRSANAVIPPDMTMAEVETAMAAMETADQPVTPEPMPSAAGPIAIAAGNFRDADSFHRGTGTATIYRNADGSHILRFEDFRVTNGPDLRVLLAQAPDPQSRQELHASDYVHLAMLKGNIGSQNYPLPPEVDPAAQAGSVIIYCQPFQVIFSVAPLAPVN